jgi:hypothetical protein
MARPSRKDPLEDFRNFLYLVWKHLGLPDPTTLQYDIAYRLQHGPKRDIIEAFRGIGKSWITVAYTLWRLKRAPETKIEVVSASKGLADNFTTFCLQLVYAMELLSDLKPDPLIGQRSSKAQFDVGPSRESKDPSVKSVGITGQLTGTRADLIIGDDVESANNTLTPTARGRIFEAVKEFDAILKPGGEIKYLGTPQTEESLYHELVSRGYSRYIIPARFPQADLAKAYGSDLAPVITQGLTADNIGKTTEPARFSDFDLAERELSYGRSGFALQFMLDPSPNTRFKYPLRLSDLIVADVNPEVAPEKVVWAAEPSRAWDNSVPCVGFSTDRYYRPMQIVGQWINYTGSVMFIDPSGRGADETGFAVTKMLNSFLYCPAAGGFQGGYDDATLTSLANVAKTNKVNRILIEDNFGDGMYAKLFTPILASIYPCTIEEIHSTGQKEKRIIDTLEPVLNRHRLILDPKVIQRDYESAQVYPAEQRRTYMLAYQLSRITRDRGSLPHDDRVEALSGSVAYWAEQMATNEDSRMEERKSELLEADLERFLEHAVGGAENNGNRTSWIHLPGRKTEPLGFIYQDETNR